MISAAEVMQHLVTVLDLPPPFSTLPAVLNESSSSPRAFLAATDDPRHLPLAITLTIIPSAWILGHISGNVSWIDRIWTTFPLLTTGCVIAWVLVNGNGDEYAASLPRISLVFLLQIVWSVRLTRHTARRGLYHLNAEDYRYVVIRKLIPAFVFELIHIFLVAIAQPLLLFALSLPVAALVQPAALLSEGAFPSLVLRYSTIRPLLPARFAEPSLNTPVLHATDALMTLLTLTAIAFEAAGDNAMYDFQTAKHALMDRQPQKKAPPRDKPSRVPTPVAVPPAYYPGFPILGLHAWSRHPNFASEQGYWLCLGFFTIFASTHPNAEAALGPVFALSLLFCASTALTEWITTRKYPVYAAYSHIVGQFLPQETLLKWTWSALRGTWPRYEAEVYKRGSQLYREAVEEGSILAAPQEDLSSSNLRVADRVVKLVPSERK